MSLDPNDISQLLVGAFLVFGRGMIVNTIKDPVRKQEVNRILKFAGPFVLGCAILVAVAGLLRKG